MSTPIYVDEESAYERAKEFLKMVMPRHVGRMRLYEGKEPMFHKYKLETEIARIHKREVPLKPADRWSSIQTEALVAIDVNSGSFRADDPPRKPPTR
jgi:ribonuclease E